MNRKCPMSKLAAAIATISLSPMVVAAPAGTLLFTKGDMQIINTAGISRTGKAGDVLQPGERVVTPDGAVCQIRLWDGSLIGVRPDTELKVDLPEQASERAKSVIQVLKGGLRVINVDLHDGRVRVPISLQSPTGVVDLTNADAESRVVSAETLKKSGVKDPGLYTRVQIGKGTIRTGSIEVPIAIRTVAFTPTIDVAPTLVSSTSTSLFTTTTLATSTLDPKLTTSLSTSTVEPRLTTSLTTTTLDPKLSDSTLITTTLSPTTSTLTSPTLTVSQTSPTLTNTLSTTTLSSTFTSPTLTTTTLTSPTLSTTTLTSPTLSSTTIAPTTYTAPTTTTTMISTTTLSSPTLTKTTTTTGTTTTFTSKTGSTLTLR